jgi:hypothetical protein
MFPPHALPQAKSSATNVSVFVNETTKVNVEARRDEWVRTTRLRAEAQAEAKAEAAGYSKAMDKKM